MVILTGYFNTTNSQKVVNFLAKNAGKSFYVREIARRLKLNPSSVYVVLTQLKRNNIVKKEVRGKMCFYTLDDSSYQIKEIKVLSVFLYIEKLVERLKPVVDKIVLFGSCADGSYSKESDIDIFIESNKEKEVRKIIDDFMRKTKEEKNIQAIIRNSKEMLEQRDSVFLKEVKKGKVLFEREINEESFWRMFEK